MAEGASDFYDFAQMLDQGRDNQAYEFFQPLGDNQYLWAKKRLIDQVRYDLVIVNGTGVNIVSVARKPSCIPESE